MNGNPTVTLAWYESLSAGYIGVTRQIDARRRGSKHLVKASAHPFETDIHAAAAELAVAKFLNREWINGRGSDADIARNVEVRYTPYANGRLVVRVPFYPDRPYVFVRGLPPTFEIVGWIYGRDAMREEWLEDPHGDGPCYMVPESALSKSFFRRKAAAAEAEAEAEEMDAELLRVLRESCSPPEEE